MTIALAGVAIAAPVDDSRLVGDAAKHNDWVTYGNGYDNQRFSGLDQVNRESVATLVQRWTYQTGISASFQTSPLIADSGRMDRRQRLFGVADQSAVEQALIASPVAP